MKHALPLVYENAKKLKQAGAPPEDIDRYVTAEGYSQPDLLEFHRTKQTPLIERTKEAATSLPTMARSIAGIAMPQVSAALGATGAMGDLGNIEEGVAAQTIRGMKSQNMLESVAPGLMVARGVSSKPSQNIMTGQATDEIGDVLRESGMTGLKAPALGMVGRAALPSSVATGAAMTKAGPIIGDSLKEVVRGIKNYGADYVYKNVYPRAEKAIRASIDKVSPGIEQFAKNIGIDRASIDYLRSRGVDTARKAAQKAKSVYDVFSNVQQRFNNKTDLANKAYEASLKKLPRNTVVIPRKTFNNLQSYLTRNRYIVNGTPTSRIDLADDAHKTLIKVYLDMKENLVQEGKSRITGGVFKDDFSTYRGLLQDAFKKATSGNKQIASIVDSLYDDFENAGATGLQQARKLEAQRFAMEREFQNRLGDPKGVATEKRLANILKLPESDLAKLREIEKYTGYDFIDDLKSIKATESLGKIDDNLRPEAIVSDLQRAMKLRDRAMIIDKYRPLFGDQTDEIFGDVIRFANTTMGLKGAATILGLLLANRLGRRAMRYLE